MVQTTIFDTENEFDWTSIQTTTDDETGEIRGQNTLYDAGYEVSSTFENGVLVSEFTFQSLEALGFQNRFVDYDAEGNPTVIGTVYPDDLRVTENFENGIRTTTVLQDGFFGDGALTWEEIRLTHDADGNIAARWINPDNGAIQFETFVPGSFETEYDYAQTKKWEFIDKRFDENGNLVERTITYDNGELRTTTFQDGTRSTIERLDEGDVFGWDSVLSTHDENGKLTSRETIGDNGIQKVETFEDGARVSNVQTDTAAAKNWDTITTLYEDGKVAKKQVALDNGDINLTLFDAGVRSQVIQYDGNDSANWFVRVLDYDADGNRSVTKYQTFEDVPSEVLELVPGIQPVANGTRFVLDFDDGEDLRDGDTVFDDLFQVTVSTDKFDLPSAIIASEYGGTNADLDLEAFNSKGADFGFSSASGDTFVFQSVSLANSFRATDTREQDWANSVTIEGYNDGVLVHSIDIDLTFDHVTHTLDWSGIDQIDFGATDTGFGQNLATLSFDDLVFIA